MTLGAASSNHTTLEAAFRGCLVHFLINDLPTTAKMQTAGKSATQSADSCRSNEAGASTLISFPTASAFLEVEHDSTKNFLDISLDFRTFESDGLLLYQEFENSGGGYFQLHLQDSRLKLILMASADSKRPQVELDTFDLAYNDGRWHAVKISLQKSLVKFSVDNEVLIRPLLTSQISLRGHLIVGGGITNFQSEIYGFIGKIFFILN